MTDLTKHQNNKMFKFQSHSNEVGVAVLAVHLRSVAFLI